MLPPQRSPNQAPCPHTQGQGLGGRGGRAGEGRLAWQKQECPLAAHPWPGPPGSRGQAAQASRPDAPLPG